MLCVHNETPGKDIRKLIATRSASGNSATSPKGDYGRWEQACPLLEASRAD